MTAGMTPAALTVAVLGLGEAGGTIARDLAAAGVRVRGYDPAVPAPPGVTAAASDADACQGADLVLSLTTAGEAEKALEQALPGLAGGRTDGRAVYADANTASAGLKQRLAATADAGRGAVRGHRHHGAGAGARAAHPDGGLRAGRGGRRPPARGAAGRR